MNPFPCLALTVLSAFVVLALVMVWINTRLIPAAHDLHGLKPNQLGIAVELARSQAEFDEMLGQPKGGPNSTAVSTRTWLGRQQILDFLFIALYAALFWILGGVEMSAGLSGALLLGAAARVAIVLAAACDVVEDVAILRALRGDPFRLPIRAFGLPKWGFFFLAALLVSAWFVYFFIHSLAAGGAGGVTFAGLSGLLLVAGGLLGLAGVIGGADAWIGRAMTYGIVPAVLALVGLLVCLRQ